VSLEGARGAIAPSILGAWLKPVRCSAEFAYFIANRYLLHPQFETLKFPCSVNICLYFLRFQFFDILKIVFFCE